MKHTHILLLVLVCLLVFLLHTQQQSHNNQTIGAVFAKGAYINANKLNKKDNDAMYNTQWLNGKIKAAGYTIDAQKSFQDATVFVPSAPQKAVVIAYRGTDFGNNAGSQNRDFGMDAIISMGNFANSTRVNKAVDLYYSVRKKYPKRLISLTGHSLGGSIADNVARRVHAAKDPAFYQLQTFDKGVGAQGLGQALEDHIFDRGRVAHERIKTDLVSVVGKHGKNVTTYDEGNLFKEGIIEAHDMKYFIDRNTTMNLGKEPDAKGRAQLQSLKGLGGSNMSKSQTMNEVMRKTNNGVFDPSQNSPMQIMNPVWWVSTAANWFG